jgi:hypothetical protein
MNTEHKGVGSTMTNYHTREELIEEFREALAHEFESYDPEYEWKHGFTMFPNQIGNFRLVVGFDENYIPRSDQEREIDPRPRPWIVGYKDSIDGRISTIGAYGKDNWFETKREAYTQFAKLLLEISDKIVELEITEETPRQAKCMSCNKLHDYQPEKYKKTNGYPGMVTLTPHLETDVVYDGCRGWD